METYLFKIVAATVLASVSCGIAGSYLVSRRLVFVGGGITHASFGGIGLGFFLGMNPIFMALLFSIGLSTGIEYVTQKQKIRSDTIIAVLWSLGMSLGILFMSLTKGYTPSLMTFLFGNISSVGWMDLWLLLSTSFILIILIRYFFYLILFHSFDLNFLKASKRQSNWVNYVMMALVSATIIFNVKIVGVVLLMALLTIPQMTIGLFTNQFKHIIIGSILISLVGSLLGVLIAWNWDLPSGVSIVLCQILIYIIAWGTTSLEILKPAQ